MIICGRGAWTPGASPFECWGASLVTPLADAVAASFPTAGIESYLNGGVNVEIATASGGERPGVITQAPRAGILKKERCSAALLAQARLKEAAEVPPAVSWRAFPFVNSAT